MDMLRPASSRGVLSLLAVVIGLAAWSASCSAQTSNPPSAPPATVEHALSNKIWRASDGQLVTVGDLVGALAKADVILVGERHGHRPHQDRVVFLLEALADRGRYPALAMEMLEPEQAEKIARFRVKEPEYSTRLGAELEWHKTGWPSWVHYDPIFSVAFTAKLPILAADLAKAEQQRIETSAPEAAADPAITDSWRASMKAAHCDLIEPDRLERVTSLQWQRDRAMAGAVRAGLAKAGQVLLLAGREHVRRDRGVPRHLAHATQNVVVVALADVKEGDIKPEAYVPARVSSVGAAPVYDYIWFTPAKAEPGACERLKGSGIVKAPLAGK